MPLSFDIVTDSTDVSVEQVQAAFSREDYWLARLTAFGGVSTLDSLVIDTDGTVTVSLTQYLGRQLLPGAVARIIPGDLKILHGETWRPVDDRRVRARIDVSAPGQLGSGQAEGWLVPDGPEGKASQLRFAASVAVRIPLLGRGFERAIAAEMAEDIPAIQRFTTSWIAEHACQ